MTPKLSALLSALDAAQTTGDEDRTLRLLAQNIPHFPQHPSIRRYLWRICIARGDDASSRAVIERAFHLEVAAGNLLGAIAALRSAENAGVAAEDGWPSLFAELSARGFGAAPLSCVDGEPDLDASRPALTGDALYELAVQVAARAPGEVASRAAFAPLPWISALPPAGLRLALTALDAARVDAGTRFTVAYEPPAWLVLGDLRDDPGARVPGGAALAGETDGVLTAHSTCWLVTFGPDAWAEFLADPEMGRRWHATLARRRLVRVLATNSVFAARPADELMERLTTARIVTSAGGVVNVGPLTPDEGVVVLRGQLQAVDDGPDAAAGPGDVLLYDEVRGRRMRAAPDTEFVELRVGPVVDGVANPA